ncbi:helix-turn-helix domain-containing protein [Photorhabdus laumondii subsp. laumondii]|uniref:Helix-turn-helix transcriptional regulator n=2 Tax=Photorhabdus TaxID=29487 RepID=A0AAW6BHR9_9GAMM|nr:MULTISPECIES: helix-turn-helix transcriptional regulator [Photorhabdus]AXG42646.1 XRE family transcriptional regulator [Photorhabdus laumondii subsp. laumondii]MCC8384764.1 helix-turn-helix transcriptional regulator [Photorhabdus laumondii]MCC8413502.1 helix-turn-helix transcriptional regulator [Photorhabdus laumondii]MDB6372301.1 helix-turn-helix transcriptional regulator [Photorhabdus bodei]NDK96452.1 helix-turn-helix domain-containing protein [Photorhabdus laumondii subsp. laumondii]
MSTTKEALLFLIGSRLREEREKTGNSQEAVASVFGISTRTWGKYERGETMPDAATITLLGERFGIDISYVLTGRRTPQTNITNEEQRLIENYRAMDSAAQLNMQAVSDSFAQSKPKKEAG